MKPLINTLKRKLCFVIAEKTIREKILGFTFFYKDLRFKQFKVSYSQNLISKLIIKGI